MPHPNGKKRRDAVNHGRVEFVTRSNRRTAPTLHRPWVFCFFFASSAFVTRLRGAAEQLFDEGWERGLN